MVFLVQGLPKAGEGPDAYIEALDANTDFDIESPCDKAAHYINFTTLIYLVLVI